MSEMSKGTGAPVAVTLTDGSTILVHPPDFRDLAEFEDFSECDLLRQCVEVGGDVETHVLRGPKAAQALIHTTRGRIRFAWIILRKTDPTITTETITEKYREIEDVMEIVNRALDQALPDVPKGGPDNKSGAF